MKKRVYITALILFLFTFTSCKITFPEKAAETSDLDESISAFSGETLSNIYASSYDALSEDVSSAATDSGKLSVSSSSSSKVNSAESRSASSSAKSNSSATAESSTSSSVASTPFGTDTSSTSTGSVTLKVIGYKSEVILPETAVKIYSGDTVFSITKALLKSKNIAFTYSGVSANGNTNNVYVKGIDGLMEGDESRTSGWIYKINNDAKRGKTSAGAAKLIDGDSVVWYFTMNMGVDISAPQELGPAE